MKATFLTATGAVAAGVSAFTYAAFRKDMKAAKARIEDEAQVICSESGVIEFGESGDGPAVLVVHGAGGGFDQGLDLGHALLGDGYRYVAPSRFGYLGTPLREDSSPEAQAVAHLRLLDALQLDAVPVIGVSAGAPSALELCLSHPERCTALVLVVPMAWAPDRSVSDAPSPFFEKVLNTIASSDLVFWTATKVARTSLVHTILGTPAADYRRATKDERRDIDRLLESMFPISRRFAGINSDSRMSANLKRCALEDIRVPTLVISASDDLYGTYESSVYTARKIPHARFAGFDSGGHLLLGHALDARAKVTAFVAEQMEGKRTAMAV